MTVAVTGASGLIGRSCLAAFVGASPEVRAIVRRRSAAEPLRALGAKVAVGELDDGDTLGAVLWGTHTVCHLVGGINLGDPAAYEEANLDSVASVLETAVEAGVRRILFLSYPGASRDATNTFLRAKGAAEELVRASGLEHVILRSTHAYGPARSAWFTTTLELASRHPPAVLGTGRQLVAPVFVDDVAAILVAADDRGKSLSGTWSVAGPDRLSADRVTELVLKEPVPPEHLGRLSAEAVSSVLGEPIDETALEVLSSDSLGDGPDAAAEFGVPLTPFAEGIRRTAQRASARIGPSEYEGE